jgi:hypothetical protein
MQHPPHRLVRRQGQASDLLSPPSASGLQGGATASSDPIIASSLLLGPSASPVSSGSDTLDPSQTENENTTLTSSTPTQTGSTSPSSASALTHGPMSTGAVIGISVAVFIVTVAAMFAVYSLIKKRTVARARRPLTRDPLPASRGTRGAKGNGQKKRWHQLEDGGDHRDGREKSSSSGVIHHARPKTPDSNKFALFEKDPSVRSLADDKANVSDLHSFGPLTMPNFAKYHPGLAEELSTVLPLPPFASHADGSQTISWDGATNHQDSFLSLHTPPSDTMSASAVLARQTPQTTDSALHRWESAEVLIMDDPTNEQPDVRSHAAENPFGDDAAPRASDDSDSRTNRSNPFFNASQHANPFSDRPSRSRKSSLSIAKRSRTNSVTTAGTVRAGANDNALLSLIAALDTVPAMSDDQSYRMSTVTLDSSTYRSEISTFRTAPKAF